MDIHLDRRVVAFDINPIYANPLAKVSLFRLVSNESDSPAENPSYALTLSFSSNGLRDEFIADHLLVVPSPVFLTARVHHGSKVSHDPLFPISLPNTAGLSHRGDERKVSQQVDPVEFESQGKIGEKDERKHLRLFFQERELLRFQRDAEDRLRCQRKMMEETDDEQVLHLAQNFARQTEGELRIFHSILNYQKEVKSIDHGRCCSPSSPSHFDDGREARGVGRRTADE